MNEFLVSIVGLVAFSFYDDKYGFELQATGGSARLVAESVHFWLGAKFDQKMSFAPTILGVTYNQLGRHAARDQGRAQRRDHARD